MTAPNHWTVSGKMLSRTFITENYEASFDLAYDIKEIADDLDHHPDILISFNNVSVSTTTHSAGSLTDKDYELAEAINEMYDNDDDSYGNYLENDDDFEDDIDEEEFDGEEEGGNETSDEPNDKTF